VQISGLVALSWRRDTNSQQCLVIVGCFFCKIQDWIKRICICICICIYGYGLCLYARLVFTF